MKLEKSIKRHIILTLTGLLLSLNYTNMTYAQVQTVEKNSTQKTLINKHKKYHAKKIKSLEQTTLTSDEKNSEKSDNTKLTAPERFDFISALSKHLTANATLTSNYVSRGISQTLNRPALQGDATYAWDNGIYATVWGSTVKFKDTGDAVTDPDTGAEIIPASKDPAARAYLELDTLLGYGYQFNDQFKIDANLARYNYPSVKEYNYNQFNSLLSFHSIELGYQYTSNYCNTHTRSAYYILGLNYDIPSNWIRIENTNIHLTYGISDNNEKSGLPSYHDYNAILSKKFKMLTLALQWASTDGRAKQSNLIDGTQWIASASIALG